MPAYAYLRKSSVRDPARDVSHQIQEHAVRELAARYGDDNGALVVLSDWDISGRLGADKRPGYRALIEAIGSGRATAIYSYSLSRLGRSLPELARLIADCDKLDIPVRLSVDAVDTSTASGRLLAHVLGAVAAFEADVSSERIRAMYAAKLARGEHIGTTRPYGEGDGEDAGAVLAAFREVGSYSGAAKLLNERGLKPRNSKRGVWWPSSVAVVVKRLDPSVSARRPTRGYAAGGTDFTLARLLRCPTCGTRLTGTRDRREIKQEVLGEVSELGLGRVRYSCRLGSVTPHQRVSVSEHLILPAIREEAERLRTPGMIADQPDDHHQRAELEARRLRIIDLFESGLIDKAERQKRLTKVDTVVAGLDSRRIVRAVPHIDWSWPPRQLNNVLRALFDRIDLDPVTFRPVRAEWIVPEWRR
jgi:DNA invertase Pin-like site-specific DNA recombinase